MDITRENLAQFMRAAESYDDWNRRCDIVKDANGGGYPDFWWDEIMVHDPGELSIASATKVRLMAKGKWPL